MADQHIDAIVEKYKVNADYAYIMRSKGRRLKDYIASNNPIIE